MAEQFLTALKDEITVLEKDLASDPRFQKLQTLRDALALYEGREAATSDSSVAHIQPTKRLTRKPSESREKAVKLAFDYARGLNHRDPVPTRVIYEDAIKGVVEIGGQDPVSNLSAMLSGSPLFNSNGRKGWTLVERDNADSDELIPIPSGPSRTENGVTYAVSAHFVPKGVPPKPYPS